MRAHLAKVLNNRDMRDIRDNPPLTWELLSHHPSHIPSGDP